MNLFGRQLTLWRPKAAPSDAAAVPVSFGDWATAWMGRVQESFAGAWQRNIEVEGPANILGFSAIYASIDTIAGDISKLRLMLMRKNMTTGISTEVTDPVDNTAFLPVLRKPNRYQTLQQFLNQWVVQKLLNGNAYILKEKDLRNVTVAMYVLNSRCVTPLIAPDGSVYYRLHKDILAGVDESAPVVPADMIMHDRCMCPWHPLVGVSPVYSAGSSTTQGIRIQANAWKFFENMSRPSGMLTAPKKINDETAARLKAHFEANFGGANFGRLLVAGDGIEYTPFAFNFVDSQLIEQLKWTVEDAARPFHIPLYKLGGPMPTFNNVAALNQEYYTQCLQTHMESIEALLEEGLGISKTGSPYEIEFDLEDLMRMDPFTRAEVNAKRIQAGYLAPNEARYTDNLPPVKGGESPVIQQQYWTLAQLEDRGPPPGAQPTSPPANAPKPAQPEGGDAPPEGAPPEGDATNTPEGKATTFETFGDMFVKRLVHEAATIQ